MSSTSSDLKNVAIFGASGNFGQHITTALRKAGFNLTIFTRKDSKSIHPPGVPVTNTSYTAKDLTQSLKGQDAVVCVFGPAAIHLQSILIDAAATAGVKRFILNDFGWGNTRKAFPEFDEIKSARKVHWDHAKTIAEHNENFTWTAISIGNPIDFALEKFPAMGFDIRKNTATIFDAGEEKYSATTLEGIGQAVVGVLESPSKTKNQFVPVSSIEICQNELLKALERVTGKKWVVQHKTTSDLIESGQAKFAAGSGGWILDLLVAQLYDPGKGRCVLLDTEKNAALLGVRRETPDEIVHKALARVAA